MNEIKIFENPQFGSIRTVEQEGEPWFAGKDVAVALGYERATKAIRDHVECEDIDGIPIQDSIGRMQKTPFINESGLYSLILSSKLPKAREFKRWVTSEVLPSIRKTGGYNTDKVLAELLNFMQEQRKINEIMLNTLANMQDVIAGMQTIPTQMPTRQLEHMQIDEEWLSATEIGRKLGMAKSTVGTMVNALGLRTPEFSRWRIQKHANGAGTVMTYSPRAVEIIKANCTIRYIYP